MFYDTSRDGVGLDLTPLISAGQSAADSYAKIRAADAAVAAAKRQPTPIMRAASAPRGINPIAYLVMGAAVIGGFFVVRRMMGRRRR
jgi:hypothetical protein